MLFPFYPVYFIILFSFFYVFFKWNALRYTKIMVRSTIQKYFTQYRVSAMGM